MKLEGGKQYLRRDGKTTGPLILKESAADDVYHDPKYDKVYWPDGSWGSTEHILDLIGPAPSPEGEDGWQRPMTLKLEVGKRYIRRDGKATGPMEWTVGGMLDPFWDPAYSHPYPLNGIYLGTSNAGLDLISLLDREPEKDSPSQAQTDRPHRNEEGKTVYCDLSCLNYQGAMADCNSAVTVLIRRINEEADLASAAAWVRLNYPKRAAEIKQTAPPVEKELEVGERVRWGSYEFTIAALSHSEACIRAWNGALQIVPLSSLRRLPQ